MPQDKAVLASSGGLDTSVCLRYLQNLHNYDVVTVTVDCGQNEDFGEIEKKSKEIGAIKHVYVDAKEEFATDYIVPCIKANGVYQNKYPLSTALARPLIAAKAIEVANIEGATAIAHGCTGKGNDQLRFDITMRALNPKLKIIAPIRDLNLTRDDEIKFAMEQHIPISPIANKYSVDLNIWGRAIEGGNLEDPYSQPPKDAFQLVDQQWSWMIYSGLWPDPLRTDLDKFIDSTQTRVTGKVRLKLQKGSLQVVGRQSPYSLYRNDLATFGAGSKFDQGLAKGFVELWGLQSIIANAVANEMKNTQNTKISSLGTLNGESLR